MFKFIRNNRRIRTKNLYCAELVRNEIIYHQNFNQTFKGIPFYPRKHVLVKKNEYDEHKYKDIFTKSSYRLFGDIRSVDESIVICDLVPLCTNKKYIKYKDVDKIFENLNSYQKKAKK